MNRIQRREMNNIEKPFSGCLGRMVNLFDLSTGVTGNRLLTDKPHREDLPISRSQSDISRMLKATLEDQIEDKMILSELGSENKRVNGIPMKMLIAQEMTKEVDGKHNSPNLVAKLMGLEALPQQQRSDSSVLMRGRSKGYSRRTLSHSDIPSGCWQEQDAFWDSGMHEIRPSPEQNYKDFYEIWKQSEISNYIRESSPKKERRNENTNEKKMALIRQKFMEAKRLSTDEKLRQSKEFQDALEVLSSNKDLFLKFLQEPNSMFSQRLLELQSVPLPAETKRITVLRPCKVVDNEKMTASEKKSDKEIKRPSQVFQTPSGDKDKSSYSPGFASQKVDERPAQPTRIVVLKPSPLKTQDIKVAISPPRMSPRVDDFNEEPEDNGTRGPREVAKEITQKMRENLMGQRRDETLLSSVFSDDFAGDESSFNKLDNEYAAGSLSDSEVMSPTSIHSWDYINRFGSPYSPSFSRASYSPESSVCREAKKRLSERWAMMASNGISHDKHGRKSSSTLGEMLALSDTAKLIRSEDDGDDRDDARGSTSSVTVNNNKEASGSSPKTISRSKSVPASSTTTGAMFNVEALEAEASKELTKSKSTKSSLKGKVSSLFFSRKKSSKEKSDTAGKGVSKHGMVETVQYTVHSPGKITDAAAQCFNDGGLEERKRFGPHASFDNTSLDLFSIGQKSGVAFPDSELLVSKPVLSANARENQDQPSPVSVLEPAFDEDNTVCELTGNMKQDCLGPRGLMQPLKSNLIDKSPPIGAIARTLSWDDTGAQTASSFPMKPPTSEGLEEREDWLCLVQRLLSQAGLEGEIQANSFFSRWHSLESPLDPSLRDIYANWNDQEPFHEVKRRRGMSDWKLIFDSVNDILVEITGYKSCDSAHQSLQEGGSGILVDRVLAKMKDLFSDELRCVPIDGGDTNSLVGENLVRKEVVGGGWVEHWRLEKDNLGKEIEGKLLQELVEEAVVDLTGRVR